ncbi:uncharacterized protein [Miscanthus floridulus]|uniref:uncharacterized protein n=1 Tax=Miscanthus floridulus TaxID=154761 RepID=UPI0034595646
MCKGYLGIEPHFELWRYFFYIYLIKKKERGRKTLVPMGCAGIHLQGQRAAENMPCQLSRSNKGWHSHWFYLKNDPAAPLPIFSVRLVEEVPLSWLWGPPVKEKKMRDLLEAITFLKTRGLRGASVIRGYHARRVVPLMARVLPMYKMTPAAQLVGTTLAHGLLRDSEVAQRVKEATGEADVVFPIPGHPAMRPDAGFIELPAGLTFRDSVAPLPEHAAVRATNRAADEQRKKEKNDEEKKRRSKQRAKLQRGKRRQGSSEEEEDDGSM